MLSLLFLGLITSIYDDDINNTNDLYLNKEERFHSLAKLTIDLVYDIYGTKEINDGDNDFEFIKDPKYSNGNIIEKIVAEDDIPKVIIYDFNGNENISKVRIVAIRGTNTLREWESNLNPIEKDGYDLGINISGRFHQGFANASLKVWNKIKNNIVNCKYPIVFTGHSRGGSISEILHVIAKKNDPKQQIYCIAFAPSPGMILEKHENYLTNDLYGFINENDPIPRLTIKNFLDMRWPFPFAPKIRTYFRVQDKVSYVFGGCFRLLFKIQKIRALLSKLLSSISLLIEDSRINYPKKAFVSKIDYFMYLCIECSLNPEKCSLSELVGKLYRLKWINYNGAFSFNKQRGCLVDSLFNLKINNAEKRKIANIKSPQEIFNNIKKHRNIFYKRALHGEVCPEPSD